ncbi:MAG: hypothetical protein IIX84_01200, partial [Oscillospiraceae bacterium]|nr:hypothetical protein [Oscillospiraceae bacterium]
MKKVALSIVLAVLLFCTSACGLIDLVRPSDTGEEVQNPNFVPPQTDIYGTWYGSPEKGGVEYVFNPDGTCVIDGQTFIWTVWSETESEIQVECSNGMWITVANLHTGMPTMFDQDIVLTRIPLLWEFCGIWETDRGKVGYLDEYEVQFFDGGHTDL